MVLPIHLQNLRASDHVGFRAVPFAHTLFVQVTGSSLPLEHSVPLSSG